MLAFYHAELSVETTTFAKIKSILANKKFSVLKDVALRTLNLDIEVAAKEFLLSPQFGELAETRRIHKNIKKIYNNLLALADGESQLDLQKIIKSIFNQVIPTDPPANDNLSSIYVSESFSLDANSLYDEISSLDTDNLCDEISSENVGSVTITFPTNEILSGEHEAVLPLQTQIGGPNRLRKSVSLPAIPLSSPFISSATIEKLTASLEKYLTQTDEVYPSLPCLDGFLAQYWDLTLVSEIEKETGKVFFNEFLACFGEVCKALKEITIDFASEYTVYCRKKEVFISYLGKSAINFPGLDFDSMRGGWQENKDPEEFIKNSILVNFKLFTQYRALEDQPNSIIHSLANLLKDAEVSLEEYSQEKAEEFFSQCKNNSDAKFSECFFRFKSIMDQLCSTLNDRTFMHMPKDSFLQRLKKGVICRRKTLQELHAAWYGKDLVVTSVKQQLLTMPWYKLWFKYGIIRLPWTSEALLNGLAHNVITHNYRKQGEYFQRQSLIVNEFANLNFDGKVNCVTTYLKNLDKWISCISTVDAAIFDSPYLFQEPVEHLLDEAQIRKFKTQFLKYKEFRRKYPILEKLEENQQYGQLLQQHKRIDAIAQRLEEVSDLLKKESNVSSSFVSESMVAPLVFTPCFFRPSILSKPVVDNHYEASAKFSVSI